MSILPTLDCLDPQGHMFGSPLFWIASMSRRCLVQRGQQLVARALLARAPDVLAHASQPGPGFRTVLDITSTLALYFHNNGRRWLARVLHKIADETATG